MLHCGHYTTVVQSCQARSGSDKCPQQQTLFLCRDVLIISRPLRYNRGAEQPRRAWVHGSPAFLWRERPSNSQCRVPVQNRTRKRKKRGKTINGTGKGQSGLVLWAFTMVASVSTLGQPPRSVSATACPELVEGKQSPSMRQDSNWFSRRPWGLLRTCGPMHARWQVPPTTNALSAEIDLRQVRPSRYNGCLLEGDACSGRWPFRLTTVLSGRQKQQR